MSKLRGRLRTLCLALLLCALLVPCPPPARAAAVHLPLVFRPPRPTATPTSTPTATATVTPTPTATSVYRNAQLLQNGSFEEGFAHWTPLGSPELSPDHPTQGSQSVLMDSVLCATPDWPLFHGRDALTQTVVVPEWAEWIIAPPWAFVEVDWLLLYYFTPDPWDPSNDMLIVEVRGGDPYGTHAAAPASRYQSGTQGTLRFQVGGFELGETLTFWIKIIGGGGPTTFWYVDNARFYFYSASAW